MKNIPESGAVKGILLAVGLLSLTVHGVDYQWCGGTDGVWNDASNWNPSSGFPDGADDTAVFAIDSATALSVSSPVAVSGIVLSGTGALTITGEKITLGAAGIASTSTKAFGISNALAVATAATPLAITGPATLSADTPAGPLHLGGVISGEGGLYKTGSAALHLHAENTFTGGLTALGNLTRPDGTETEDKKSYAKDASSEVFVYTGRSLGAGDVTLDPEDEAGSGKGCRLTLMAPMTVSNELFLSGDVDDGLGSLKLAAPNGTYIFESPISTALRFRVGIQDGCEVRFRGAVTCSNWCRCNSIGSTRIWSCYFDAASSIHVMSHDEPKASIYFMAEGNVFSQVFGVPIIMGTENAFSPRLAIWRWDTSTTILDLNGFDQTINYWSAAHYRERATTHGFRSASPAKIRFRGDQIADLKFGGCFYGAAGLEWSPRYDKTLTLTNSAPQSTTGDMVVSNGIVRLENGMTFMSLSSLKIVSAATLSVAKGSGEGFAAVSADVETAAHIAPFALEAGVQLRFGALTVDGKSIDIGTTLTSETHPKVVSGEGSVLVASVPVPVHWTGSSGGKWSEPDNWSTGSVPDENSSVTITDASVLVDAPVAPVYRIVVGDGQTAATLMVTNAGSTLSAEYFYVAKKGIVTSSGPFTDEAGLAPVHIVCTNLTVAEGGAIDVTRKGWSGGLWRIDENGTYVKVNVFGYGPGTINSYSGYVGASHGGRGAMLWAVAKPSTKWTYGDAANPITPGSGGSMCISWGGEISRLRGHSGGGVIRIEASGDVNVKGAVRADGGGLSGNGGSRDCAASGGSVWITCNTVSGSGTISAEGGDGGDPRLPVYILRNLDSSDIRYGFAGGGGRIAIDYNPDAQVAADVEGLFISAAAGEYYSEYSTLATRDNEETPAESGTLHFSDTALVKRLFGNGLSGRVVGLSSLSFEGDVDFHRGFFQSMEEGFTLEVDGDLVVKGPEARLEVGGVMMSNLASRATIWGGSKLNRLIVGGDFTVSDGGSFLLRAAETNATMKWGAEALITGAMTIGDGGFVYASSDGCNLGSPRFLPGSLTVAANGTFSADRRGGLGAHCDSSRAAYGFTRTYGYGPGGGNKPNAAGHGGVGGKSGHIDADSYYGYDNGHGDTYDDEWRPMMPGSGGGNEKIDSSCGAGGTGGGLIYVETPGAIVVNGKISADGWCDGYYNTATDGVVASMRRFGSGSGGTVFLFGETFTGGEDAVITAKGGPAAQDKAGKSFSGSGGGGRIAVWTGYSFYANGSCLLKKRTENPFDFTGTFDVSAGERLIPKDATVRSDEEIAFSLGGDGTVRFVTCIKRPGTVVVFR